MPRPRPGKDPALIETRLLVVAEMLERAVDEVRRAMCEYRGDAAVALPLHTHEGCDECQRALEHRALHPPPAQEYPDERC